MARGTENLSRCTSALSLKSGVSATSGFSERDVAQMKRLLADTERKEKIDIIAIKGLDIDEKNIRANKVVQNISKDKIKVEVEVKSAWVRGKVIVAKLGSVEEKEKVMRNKNKLAGTRIFIENFRNYDERKRQEKIRAWLKTKKEKGWLLKIGFGKIFLKDTWYRWKDKDNLEKRVLEVVEEVRNGNGNNSQDEGPNLG